MRNWFIKKTIEKGKPIAKKLVEYVVPKIKKNLASRRKVQDELIATVNKQYTKVGVKPGSGAAKIKKDAVSKSSKMHDKWEKWGWKQSDKDLGK